MMIFPQICEITADNNSIVGAKSGKMDKHFLKLEKFPQTASERLDFAKLSLNLNLNKTWLR